MRCRVGRVQCNSVLKLFDPFIEAAQIAKRRANAGMHFRRVRLTDEGFTVVLKRLFGSSGSGKRFREIHVQGS